VAVAPVSKPASVEVRAMLPDDLRFVCDLNLQLGYSGTLEQIGARFESVGGRAGHGVFVALLDQRLVGWVHVRSEHSLESEPYAEITGLVVDQSERRCGVGRALVERACKWARKGRYASLRVRSNIERHEAHQFYPRLGFHVVKTQHNYALDLTSGDDSLD
jgi:ribosomal protein S18 acetylase RimI-like enzyme